MKLVYCLSGESAHAVVAMLRLSIATARYTTPASVVELVVDRLSLDDLQASRSRLLEEVDATHVRAVPPGPAALRSRCLKTGMRGVVEGAFLFLDADTVIRKPLRPWWPDGTDVAAGSNYSRDSLEEQLSGDESAYLAAMGWPTPACYLNSGVIYFADSPRAHAVGRLWQECWTSGMHSTGQHVDQPSFNHAVRACAAETCLLPHGWNAQINRSPRAALDATIWHYYHSRNRPADTSFAIETRRLDPRQPVSTSVVQRLVNAAVPWPTDSWLERTIVARMLRHDRPSPFGSLLLAGDYPLAVRHAARATIDRFTHPTGRPRT
jgi:hypothetical protein